MDDITGLCSDIEDRLETFELTHPIKVKTIYIDRNENGEITAVRAAATGEYRNPNR